MHTTKKTMEAVFECLANFSEMTKEEILAKINASMEEESQFPTDHLPEGSY